MVQVNTYNSATLPTPRTDGDTRAYMTVSVDNPSDSGGANQPDTLANPTEDPFILEARMTIIGGNSYRAVFTIPGSTLMGGACRSRPTKAVRITSSFNNPRIGKPF